MNENHIIQQVLRGQKRPFAVLVDRYQGMIFRVILGMVKQEQIAQEITQDTFIKAYRNLALYESKSKFSTWLYRIAYNEAASHLRKRKLFFSSVDEHKETIVCSQSDGITSLEEKDRKNTILQALRNLPSVDALLLNLYYLEELSIKEIAEVTSTREGSVKMKIHRARKKLLNEFNQLSIHDLNEIL